LINLLRADGRGLPDIRVDPIGKRDGDTFGLLAYRESFFRMPFLENAGKTVGDILAVNMLFTAKTLESDMFD
jgi:hypothetical protein